MTTQPNRPLRWTVATAMFAAIATTVPITTSGTVAAATTITVTNIVVGHG